MRALRSAKLSQTQTRSHQGAPNDDYNNPVESPYFEENTWLVEILELHYTLCLRTSLSRTTDLLIKFHATI